VAPAGELRQKAARVFAQVFVDHNTSAALRAARDLPRYLVDFLVGQYGLEGAERKVSQHLATNRTRQLLRSRLLQRRTLELLDFVDVRIDLNRGEAVARLMAFQVDGVYVDQDLLQDHPDLLQGGLWGKVCLLYVGGSEGESSRLRMVMVHFEPYQALVDLRSFAAARRQFSTAEWVELLLRSAGYNPETLFAHGDGRRLRWLYLARLLPLVERNVNMIELGPKNTGKTFLLRNLSAQAFTMAGGYASPANLFYNLATRRGGLIASREVLVFDEVAYTRFTDDSGTIALLKDFMESGQFSRGHAAQSADTSLVFLGNLQVDQQLPSAQYAHLFEPLPVELQDAALVDRIHGFIPGWELPKLKPADLVPGFSLSTDYFGEILLALRHLRYEEHWQSLVSTYPHLKGMTRRDATAVDRLGRAFFKLVFPDGQFTEPEAVELLSIVGELRQRVEHQLEIMDPGEFFPHPIGFESGDEEGREQAKPMDFLRRMAYDDLDRRVNESPDVGEVTALTVLTANGREYGGAVQMIQVSVIDGGSGQIRLTGQHGRDMSHSLRTGHDLLLRHATEIGYGLERIRTVDLAVHLVSISQYREGASAGLAFVLAMVSALLDKPVRAALAVTGEVSLHGDITAVGGISHKLTAAGQHGRRIVLIPEGNRADMQSAPKWVGERLEVVAVRDIRQALQIAFAD